MENYIELNKENIQKIAHLFKRGRVGIFPTDTAFGIGCKISDVDAVKKIFTIRNRPAEKAMLILCSDLKMADDYVSKIPDRVREKLINRYWPGGLTIIFQANSGKIPSIVRGGGQTIGVRIPDNSMLRKLISEIGEPIIAPSANFSGKKTPYTLEDIDNNLLELVDFVISGSCTIKMQSTVIDCINEPWKVLREGTVKIHENNY